MAKIFISYRRTDSATISGRVYDRLVAKFKRKNLFKDVDNIPAGVDFGAYIQQSLRECAVMLVVIGPRWLGARADDGSRRLDNPRDWVRVEIEAALQLGLMVIPLLVEGASIPKPTDLPESLQELVRLNALPVRNDPDFARDMERVIAAIEHASMAQRAQRPASLPGVFRRGKSPRPLSATEATPEPAEPDAPTTPSAMVAPNVAPDIQPIQPPISRAPNKNRIRGAVLAGVAVVLVVASLAVLLSRGVIPVGADGRTNQQATRTATIPPLPTATPWRVLNQPLVFKLPGPGTCAQVSQEELGDLAWLTTTGKDDVDCSSGQAMRLYPGSCNCAKYQGELDFSAENAGFHFPSTYTISVTVSKVTNITEAHLFLMSLTGPGTTIVYDFGLYNNVQITGEAYYLVPGSSCSGKGCEGFFEVNKANTLAFHVEGNTITALFNGIAVASQAVASAQTISYVGLGVSIISQGTGYTDNPYHADFANFTITPS